MAAGVRFRQLDIVMTRILTKAQFMDEIGESLLPDSDVARRFSEFVDSLDRLGIKPIRMQASVAVRYDPSRAGSKRLSILIVSLEGSVWAGFWLENQLERCGVSSELATQFWKRLSDIDARFESCDKRPRTHHVPIKDIANRL